MGLNGCLLYSVAGEVLGSGLDSFGGGRGERGRECLWGAHKCPLLSWAFPHSHFCVLQTLTWWITCCMPHAMRLSRAGVTEVLKRDSLSLPQLNHPRLPRHPSPRSSLNLFPSVHEQTITLPPLLCSSPSNHLSQKSRHTAPRCSTFSFFLCPLALSSPPLIGGWRCLWIGAPSSQ